jgi:hypothetical protein
MTNLTIQNDATSHDGHQVEQVYTILCAVAAFVNSQLFCHEIIFMQSNIISIVMIGFHNFDKNGMFCAGDHVTLPQDVEQRVGDNVFFVQRGK